MTVKSYPGFDGEDEEKPEDQDSPEARLADARAGWFGIHRNPDATPEQERLLEQRWTMEVLLRRDDIQKKWTARKRCRRAGRDWDESNSREASWMSWELPEIESSAASERPTCEQDYWQHQIQHLIYRSA